jgi:hypothetical protein
VNAEELENLLALIQTGMTQHFFKNAGNQSAAELRQSGNALAKSLLRIRLALTTDYFDDDFY